MKVGLYSISCSGIWFKDRAPLTVEEFIDTAKKYGYDGVELDLKRPHGSPLELTTARCKEIAAYIKDAGLELSGTAANNNFASIVAEQIENELLMVREQIRVAKDLGSHVLRLFAAWPGIVKKDGLATYEITRNYEWYGALDYQKRQSVLACLKECVKWAEDAGVVLALQNHHPVINTYQDMLDFVHWVDSPWLKCCFDAPCCGWSEATQNDAYMAKAVRDVGNLQMMTHANAEFVEHADGTITMIPWDAKYPVLTNYPTFVKTLEEVGYEGYINYEFCHMPFHKGEVLGYEYIEDQIRIAPKYFRSLMKG